MRVNALTAALALSACSGSDWSQVDTWAKQQAPLKLAFQNSHGRTYAMPNVGQFEPVGVEDSFIVVWFESPRSSPKRWLMDFDCDAEMVAAYSTESTNGAIRRDTLLGREVRDADGKLFRLTDERRIEPDEKEAFCTHDWANERKQAHRLFQGK